MDNPVPEKPSTPIAPIEPPANPLPKAEPQIGFPQPVVIETSTPPTPMAPASDHTSVLPGSEKPKSKTSLLMVVAILLLLLAIGVLGFFIFRNMQQKSSSETPTPTPPVATPTETATPSVTPVEDLPQVSSPSAGMKVKSPLMVTGKVPAGWMFEGVFPIQLVDADKKLIVAGTGKEKVAGSWTSGGLIDFESTLSFTTTAKTGFLILKKDNPSGLPANDKSFEVPITF